MSEEIFFRKKVLTMNGIMCVLVVFLHSYNIERYRNLKWSITPLLESFISRSLGNLAVPTFFFISAILFFQNYDLSKMWYKYKSRISSIVIPYLLWNTIYLITFMIIVNFPLSRHFMDTKEISINLKVVINSVFFHQYNGVYWYMYQLILFVFFSPIIYLVMRTSYGIIVVPCLLIISYWWPVVPNYSNGIIVNSLIYWVLGAYFALHRREQVYHSCINTKKYLMLSVNLIIIRFYLEFIIHRSEINNYVLNFLLLLNVISLWFALDVLKFQKVYEWMSMSFFIYTVHPLIVWSVKNGISLLLPENDVMALINYMVSGIAGVTLSMCIAKIMNCCMPKLFSILCGKREIYNG